MTKLADFLAHLGSRITGAVWRLGFASRFFWLILRHSGTSFRRFHLTIREIYFAGVLSLIIILVSGLFVGMVLGLQGLRRAIPDQRVVALQSEDHTDKQT